MSYYTYVISSQVRKYIYIGISNNVERRLHQHNSGYNRSTKPYIPFVLVLVEEFSNRFEARKREKYLKTTTGRRYIKEIIAHPRAGLSTAR